MLDKSKGLTLGPELVTNGAFDTDTDGWSAFGSGITLSYSSGRLRTVVSNSNGTVGARQVISGLTAGKTYLISADFWDITNSATNGPTLRWANGDVTSGFTVIYNDSTGAEDGLTVSGVVVPSGTSITVGLVSGGNGGSLTAEYDNISVKELPGFHATQPTAAARPTYGIVPAGGRRNLVTYSNDDFTSIGPWEPNVGVSTSVGAGVSPSGETDAVEVIENSATSGHYVTSSITVTSGATLTFSCHVKSGNGSRSALMRTNNEGTTTYIIFDFSTGMVTESGADVTQSTVDDLGNGWYRLSFTYVQSADTTSGMIVGLSNSTTPATSVPTYLGDGTSSILIYGAQLELGSTATAYQRVSTEFDVTEAGVTSLGYLSFDGVDDWMVTPTITPGIDKVQVFAGAKANANVTAIILEHSVNTGTNNGSLALYRDSTGYGFNSKGTTLRAANVTTGFSSPDDSVLRGLGDISGDNSQVFRNQSLLAENTDDQGTGNYLAYPMYIGSRAGTSLRFNGQIYSLITRFGTNLEVAQIESTEAYVAGKTAGVDL